MDAAGYELRAKRLQRLARSRQKESKWPQKKLQIAEDALINVLRCSTAFNGLKPYSYEILHDIADTALRNIGVLER